MAAETMTAFQNPGGYTECYGRPSKCPKFYTSIISGEQNLRQKEQKICQKFYSDKITYLNIYLNKYTLQYSFQYKTIQDSYIIKLPYVNLLQS